MLRFSSVRLLSVAPDKNGRKIRCLAHRKFLRVRSVSGGGGVVAPFFRNLGGAWGGNIWTRWAKNGGGRILLE